MNVTVWEMGLCINVFPDHINTIYKKKTKIRWVETPNQVSMYIFTDHTIAGGYGVLAVSRGKAFLGIHKRG